MKYTDWVVVIQVKTHNGKMTIDEVVSETNAFSAVKTVIFNHNVKEEDIETVNSTQDYGE